jgi:hypothetical protein
MKLVLTFRLKRRGWELRGKVAVDLWDVLAVLLALGWFSG